MRVITGSARGRKLVTLPGEDIIRPTADKVKGAIFSSIQFEIEGRNVLDMYAGSGALGIEALSRGAGSCVFAEINKKAVEVIKKNLDTCGLSDRAKVVNSDAVSYLRTTFEGFDIILADPPYKSGLALRTLNAAAQCAREGGIIVIETAKEEELPERAGSFVLAKHSAYSKTAIYIYRYQTET